MKQDTSKVQHNIYKFFFSATCRKSLSVLEFYLEGHDEMSEMKLCFQIQLNKDFRLSWRSETETVTEREIFF